MVCVMWNTSVLVGHILALREGSVVGWMTKESYIIVRQGEVFCHYKASRQTLEASPATHSVCTQG
jgi:hypothetical protein